MAGRGPPTPLSAAHGLGHFASVRNAALFESSLRNPRRQHLLTRAYNTGYSDRVAAIFKSYIASQIPARERTQTRLPHEGTGPQPTIRTADLTRGKIWSKAEIHAFYRDCRRGVYDKREPERLQIEQEIFKAAQQGRVAVDAVQPRMRGRKPYE